MELNFKKFRLLKTTKFIYANKLLFFVYSVNKNSKDWILTEQSLKKLNFEYYKVFKKSANEILNTSIFHNTKNLIQGTVFLIKPKKPFMLIRKLQIKELEFFLFNILSIKLNNKIYSAKQLSRTKSLEYLEIKLILYQYSVSNLKSYTKFYKNIK